MLAQRVLSAIVLGPLLLLAAAAGGLWFLAVGILVSLLATREFYSLLRDAGFSPLWPLGMFLGPVFLADMYLQGGRASIHFLAAAVILSLTYLLVRQRLDGSLIDWAVTWLPPLYAGLLLSYAVALRQLPSGDIWVYLVLGITWATDSGAYFVGRSFGRRKFFPRISPRKTLEGAIGGAACGVAAGAGIAWAFGWSVPVLVPYFVAAAVAAEVGDLAESFIKRQLGTKDAGQLIPGHGGILDRMDSVLFVGVLTHLWASSSSWMP